MSGTEGIGLVGRIAKLRRDMPRNGDVRSKFQYPYHAKTWHS
jgi:hypothetical protein